MMRGIDEEKLGNSNKNRTSRCSIKEGRVGGSWGMDGGRLRASGVAIQHTQVNKQKVNFYTMLFATLCLCNSGHFHP